MSPETKSYLIGLFVLGILYVFLGLSAGTWRLTDLYRGADQRPSTSKFQFLLWTIVVLFSYVTLFVLRALLHSFSTVEDLARSLEPPRNLLIAMGLSVTTVVAAKGITVAYVASGRVVKPAAAGTPAPETPALQTQAPQSATRIKGGLLRDDDGDPDLSKVQLLSWTLIAIGAYLFQFSERLAILTPLTARTATLPDIDTSLMVLMGLGQGAYLGKKLTTTDTARITGISPSRGMPGNEVSLIGLSFGETQSGSLITIDGQTVTSTTVWKDTQVIFKIPVKRPDNTDWTPGQLLAIGLIVGGQASANTVPFTIVA